MSLDKSSIANDKPIESNSEIDEHQVLQEVIRLLTMPEIEENDKAAPQINELKLQNNELRAVLAKMASLLRDKTGQCLTLEKKSSALTLQAASLKEVIAITKELLNIRNAEVQHLQEDMASMEEKLANERKRHDMVLESVKTSNELTAKLRSEYESQRELIQTLREQYQRRDKLLGSLQS